jgi:hypothetical protein
MLSDVLLNMFTPQGFTGLLGVLLLILQFMYVIFALLVVRQVSLLNTSFKTGMAPIFTFTAYAHFLLAVLVLLFSVFAL